MRKAVVLVSGLIVLLLINYGIHDRERVLRDGRVVLLELSPVDPRSLMQGDYMRLNFAVADEAVRRGPPRGDGHIVVGVDRYGVARYRRVGSGGRLARDEMALRYRMRAGQMRFATDAFFFQEGQAAAFAPARYGRFRVDPDGDMILTDLLGPDRETLPAPGRGTRR